MVSALKNSSAIATLLLNCHAKLNEKVYDDYKQISLVSFALKKSNADIIKLLLKAIATQTNDKKYHTTLEDIENSDNHEAHQYALYYLAALIAFHQSKNSDETSLIREANQTLSTKLLKTAITALERNDLEEFNDCVNLETKVFSHPSPSEKIEKASACR